MRLVVIAFGLCGCDALFSITPLTVPDACAITNVYPMDNFTGADQPCTPWGQPTHTDGTVPTLTTGVGGAGLGVTIDHDRYNGCYTTGLTIDPTFGMFLEVDNPVKSGGLYTVFHAYASAAGNVSASFVATDTGLDFRTGPDPDTEATLATISYGIDPKWWRFRVTDSGIAGDTSPDGTKWNVITIAPGTVGNVDVDFGAGSVSGSVLPTPAPTVVFRNFNTCAI